MNTMNTTTSHYKTLGVYRTSTGADIETAYLERSLRTEDASERAILDQAYYTLSNPHTREQYDAQLFAPKSSDSEPTQVLQPMVPEQTYAAPENVNPVMSQVPQISAAARVDWAMQRNELERQLELTYAPRNRLLMAIWGAIGGLGFLGLFVYGVITIIALAAARSGDISDGASMGFFFGIVPLFALLILYCASPWILRGRRRRKINAALREHYLYGEANGLN